MGNYNLLHSFITPRAYSVSMVTSIILCLFTEGSTIQYDTGERGVQGCYTRVSYFVFSKKK